MSVPVLTATYRLQVNAGFTFRQVRERVEYFQNLGVSHLYLSPILAARPGSMHGYDVVDPTRINPEIGTETELRELADDLHARQMGLIVDTVPNHMGVGPENPYWTDVLEHGERSRYAKWFDIDWTSSANGPPKVVLPVLGDELERVIERGELSVRISDAGLPRLSYFNNSFPVDLAALPPELELAEIDPEETGGLTALFSGADEESRERLRALLDVQHYRLAFWRRGPAEINYRRFFDVNDLVGIRVEDESVFADTHALVLRLVRERVITGLRVDHIDGLLDPLAYLERLRAAMPADTPVFVEKILSRGESLRASWPVDGTTGYEFLNDVEDVFIDQEGFAAIDRSYRAFRRLGSTTFHAIANAGKRAFLEGPLNADVTRLVRRALRLTREHGISASAAEIGAALVAFLTALPVYRTYVAPNTPIDPADHAVVDGALREALRDDSVRAGARPDLLAFIAELVLGADERVDRAKRTAFVQRLQQVSGPATAKGIEDTALYAYVPLVSRNEVGGAPDRPLISAVDHLHETNRARAERWPRTLLATNTHDTKRSADVRSRLDVLTEMPNEWGRAIKRWRRLNQKHRQVIRGRLAPDTNTEYLLYQTLVALWPPPRAARRVDDLPDRQWRDAARERLRQYMLKAAREAKTRTSWVDPDAEYERALAEFIGAILEPSDDAPFLADVARLVSRIAAAGTANALSRVAIHLTSPGTPDIYQGDELWNYTLVDPDNRRPVDYDARASAIRSLDDLAERLRGGADVDWFDSRLKLLVTHRLLTLRRERPAMFASGSYVPLVVAGPRAEHVVAFERQAEAQRSVTIATRLPCALVSAQASDWWGDTFVVLPSADDETQTFTSRVTGAVLAANASRIEVRNALGKLPAAVLAN